MKEQLTGDCPLCDTDAVYYFTDKKNIRVYMCEKCTCFGISTRAETLVKGKAENTRTHLSAMARNTPDGQYLRVTYTSTKKGIQLITEYVCRL